MLIKKLIRTIPDYPKQGILFRDVTTLFKDPDGFGLAVDKLFNRYAEMKIDKVVAIEARGFIIGAPLALRLGAGFIPARKKGKLPAKTIGCDYDLEYGTDRIEIHADALLPGERVLLIDDLIATGGTAEAAINLIQQCSGNIVECAFIIDLPELGGKDRIEGLGLKVHTLIEFEGH